MPGMEDAECVIKKRGGASPARAVLAQLARMSRHLPTQLLPRFRATAKPTHKLDALGNLDLEVRVRKRAPLDAVESLSRSIAGT